MSNRLSLAHVAHRIEIHAPFAAHAPESGVLAVAGRWLAGLADKDEMALTPALRRDLGLPAAADGFRIDAERSRLGV